MFKLIEEYKNFKQWKKANACHKHGIARLCSLQLSNYTQEECILAAFKDSGIPYDYQGYVAITLINRSNRSTDLLTLAQALAVYKNAVLAMWNK